MFDIFSRDSQLSIYGCPAMSMELVIDVTESDSVDRGMLAVVSIRSLRGIVLIPSQYPGLVAVSLLYSR